MLQVSKNFSLWCIIQYDKINGLFLFLSVDGGFTPYSNFSACSKTCGGGIQSRMRSCSNPQPRYGGKNCTGDYKEARECNTQPCPSKLVLWGT